MKKKRLEPQIEKFKLSQLKVAGYNPRTISKDALDGLKNSIERFGCVEPIIVNVRRGARTIVGGHQRLKALKKLGIKEAVCVTVNCGKKDERLLNLTLNNPAIQGEFIEQIGEYIDALRKQIPDRDIVGLRISQLQADLGFEHEKKGNVPDDDIPKPPKKAKTKPGDLWILGRHRLLCGDSTIEADVTKLMRKEKASLFATDPPYCVDYTGGNRPGKKGKDWSGIYREIDIKDMIEFYKEFYKNGIRFVKPRTAFYLWHADKKRSQLENICEQIGLFIHQQIIWVKPCIVLGFSYYCSRHEPCLMLWQKKQKPPIDINKRKTTAKYNTVWPVGYQRTGDPTTPEYYTDVWELDYDGKKRPSGIDHPTIKPVEVFAIPMRIHTRPGDICYEPFCGSGTQIIAAEKLSRRCYAMELEPLFVDVAVKRWEQWTGKKAKRK